MENIYKTTRARLNEQGMVLVIVMLFLLITSLLALSLLNGSLLETKMSSYYQDKVRAFYLAEDYLAQYEQEILAGREVAGAKIIDAGVCGATFYQITANAKHNAVVSKLQSTFVKVDDTAHCDPKLNVMPGRQSFLVVE
ncbi:MAG: hypothetical protein ACD_21C00274G0001 [uncultured bacterium]|nr:MAG: hypothetical protein ACD_21C00274G0001 [uncultured bacterium]